jgi:putative DNA primase/helicase
MARLQVRCAWLATGNNPTVSTEISRRTVRIRLDARLDRPWLRSGFRHKKLRQWALKHRGELVWAALTMIRAWIATGRPAGEKSLGMFERWSEVIGGILSVAGVPGFLSNLEEFYEESDAEGASWRTFLAAWWEKYGEKEITVKDLWCIVSEESFLPLGDGTEQSQRVKLGKMLAERRDRVFDLEIGISQLRLSLQRGSQRQRAYRWKLQATKDR